MRFMINSLSQSIDKVSEIDKEISYFPLIEKFLNTCQLCNNDLNKFDLLLRKGVYPYEYMDRWKRFKEESFYLIKNLFTVNYIKNILLMKNMLMLKKYGAHLTSKTWASIMTLYVQSDAALLADVFDKCIGIYDPDPAHFLSAPGLSWQACLKKTNVELELLTDNDMLIFFEEGIRGGICQAIYRYAKANNKYMNNYDENHQIMNNYDKNHHS